MTVEVVIGLLAIIGTAIWAVAQIKEAVSNLALEVKHLADTVSKLDEGHNDHERRLRHVERNHKSAP